MPISALDRLAPLVAEADAPPELAEEEPAPVPDTPHCDGESSQDEPKLVSDPNQPALIAAYTAFCNT